MALLKVMFDDWQMECCGTPFSVGDEVAWSLSGEAPLYSVELHGDEEADTVGRVRSIEVVTRGFTLPAGTRTFEPVAGEQWLRAVDRCPKWFSDSVEGSRERGYFRREVGVLVCLEVPGGAA
ncbi:DUF6578 domain-containing protein [Streptomyces sp. NPDC048441]|uniref:DUF6578 domain-containing protein n=1 Tax=Streptomyces sp. NPDC048441 TaxID=3365552 RepID=UPI00371B24B1